MRYMMQVVGHRVVEAWDDGVWHGFGSVYTAPDAADVQDEEIQVNCELTLSTFHFHEDHLIEITAEQYDYIIGNMSPEYSIEDAVGEVLHEHDLLVASDEAGNMWTEALLDSPHNLNEKFRQFVRAARELTDAWEGIEESVEDAVGINEGYPFDKSFDELTAEIEEWYEQAKRKDDGK